MLSAVGSARFSASQDPPPLHEVKIFLHIRDHSRDGEHSNGVNSKRHAKKLAHKLGAALTVSESVADIIIFYEGSQAFLENMTALGKVVVRPDYLMACTQQMRKVEPRPFVVTPSAIALPYASQVSEASPQLSRSAKRQRTKPSPALRKNTKMEAEKNKTCVAGSAKHAVPYLLDDEEDVEDRTDGDKTNEATPTRERSGSRSQVAGERTAGSRFFVEDELRHAVVRAIARQPGNSVTDANRKIRGTRGAPVDPFLHTPSEDGTVFGSGSLACKDDTAAPTQPLHTPADTRATFGNVGPSVADKDTIAGASHALKSTTRREFAAPQKTALVTAPSKRARSVSTTVSSTQLCMDFTNTEKLQLLDDTPGAPGVSSLRVAISVADPTQEHFLADVVEQLGARYVGGSFFGRCRKPTHFVADRNCEITPNFLLAQALGIPIVTPQWLHDAIALGGPVKIHPGIHLHPQCVPQKEFEVVDASLKANVACSSPPPDGLANKRGRRSNNNAEINFLLKGLAEEERPVGSQWERPYHRALLKGMVFYLHIRQQDLDGVGRSSRGRSARRCEPAGVHQPIVLDNPVVALEQAGELIRTLGGSITRNICSVHLDMIVDLLGFYNCHGAGPRIHGDVYGSMASDHEGSESGFQQESLTVAYQIALRRLEKYSQAGPDATSFSHACREGANGRFTERTDLNALMAQRVGINAVGMQSKEGMCEGGQPPVVSLEWLLHTIVSGTRTDPTPFIIPVNSSAGTGISTEPACTSGITEEKLPCVSSPPSVPLLPVDLTVASVQPSFEAGDSLETCGAASAFRKTHAGPDSAKKYAHNQLNTQQIELALGQICEETMDSTLSSIPSTANNANDNGADDAIRERAYHGSSPVCLGPGL